MSLCAFGGLCARWCCWLLFHRAACLVAPERHLAEFFLSLKFSSIYRQAYLIFVDFTIILIFVKAKVNKHFENPDLYFLWFKS